MAKTAKTQAITVTSASVSGVDVVLQSISALAEKRHALVIADKKVGEIQQDYADQMNASFGFGWWDAKGEIKKAVKAEHQAFVADFEQAGKTRANIDQMWARIKKAAGKPENAKPVVSGGSDGVDSKTIAELKTIYRRIADSTEDVSPLSYKVKPLLEDVLDLLGVEI